MPPINQTVSGHIYDEYDAPIANAKVKAFDKNLRTEKLLAQAATDAQGFYKISYLPVDAGNGEYKSADVFLKVIAGTTRSNQQSGESPVHFNVPADYVLDFKFGNTAYKGLAEFDRIVALLKPILAGQQVGLGGLNEEEHHDISFLAGETGSNQDYISFINTAYLFSKQTQVAPDIFYGLFRIGFPMVINELLMIKADSIKKAIHQAMYENIISSKWAKGIDKIIITLNALSVKKLMDGTDEQSTAFKKLFGATLPVDQQKVFTATYFDNEETPEKFWEQLKQQPGFTDSKAIEKTKQILRLNVLTTNQPELTNQLFKAQETDVELKDIRGFAKYTQADWKRQITEARVVNFPEWVSGTTTEEKSDSYAASLEQLHKQIYPTTFFAQRLKKDAQSSFALKSDLDVFFTKNPDFDLQTNSIHKQFEQSSFESIEDQVGLNKELRTINRLYKLTGNYNNLKAFYSKKLFSATDIVAKYGEAQFKKEFTAVVGDAESAAKIYQNAVSVSNKLDVLIAGYKMRHDIKLFAIDGNETAPNGINEAPEGYHEMFGDGELCECEHCQSVYSPAAYFVDMLTFIKGRNEDAYSRLIVNSPEPGEKAKIGRRPDLDDIKLTCKNTNTPLPYIDLVNELLEKKVLKLSRSEDSTEPEPEDHSFQTEGEAAELAAMPEHISNAAYEHLKNVNGDAVFSPILPFDQPLEEIRIYIEKLGWNRLELMESFYGNKEPGKLNDPVVAAELFGFSIAELNIISGTHPLTITLPGSNKIDAFLDKTKLSYIELLQLLETYFLNPDRTYSIEQEPEEGEEEPLLSCNLDKLFINGATDAWLNKLVRFVRLWKKLGWNIFDLDRALKALGLKDFPAAEAEFDTEFNDKLLLPLSHLQRIQQQLNLPLVEVMTLFANIDTSIYIDHSKDGKPQMASLYQQVFLNRTVYDLVNPAFSITELAQDDDTEPSIAPHKEFLSSALRLTLPDLELLLNGNEILSLETLSRLYRFSLLLRALRTTVQELLTVISITGNKLVDGDWTTTSILEFLEDWNLFKSSGIASDNYQLLLNTKVGSDYKLPVDGNLVGVFSGHLNALQVIKAITDGDQQKTQLNARIELTIQSLTSIKIVLQDITVKLTHPDDLVLKANVEGYLGEENKETLLSSTPNELISRLTVLKSSFEEYQFWKSTPVIFKTLSFDLKKIHWLEANKKQTGTALLWNEPIDFTNPDLYTAFKKLFHLSILNKVKTGNDLSWTDLLDKAIKNVANAKAEFLDLLITLYRVSESSLNFLAGSKDDPNNKGELNLNFPDDFKEAKVILNLLSYSSLMDKLGATGNQVQALTSANTTPEHAQAAKSLLKSRYSNTDWLSIIKPVNDGFRTRRRDALLAWLLANAGVTSWKKNNDIYEALLIDVEMEACMVTSRIKQAISSVQLFINRCLMNLEAGIQLDDQFATQWHRWRKQYRVWEANRKVFLYPENWIEPELRDGKSSFFKDLESQLKQNEVTEETAKEALLVYLGKLDTVSNLEMVGLFNDEETKIVHVFGRTHNIPHLYYYRKLENSVWSPWDKLEIDIEGDHILPVVWNGRLMLFWAQFTEKQEEGSSSTLITGGPGDMTMSSPPPSTYLKVKLAWSEFKKGKWGSKKISKEFLNTPVNASGNKFHFNSSTNEGKLFIKLFWWLTAPNFEFLSNLGLGVFIFDSCNSSPVIKQIGMHNPLIQDFELIPGVISDFVFLKENPTASDQKFQLYNSGLYSESNKTYNNIFLNTPGKFQLLPNHHELEKDKPVKFFYNNEVNNFYVHSKEKFRPVTGDFSLDNAGVIIARRTVSPISTGATIAANLNSTTLRRTTDFLNETINPDLFNGVNEIREPYRILYGKKYLFQTFYHPYTCEYIKKLNTQGFEALYTSDTQNKVPKILFTATAYNPTELVLNPYPKEEVDFSYTGSYALYNWELFFHIPLLIATRLSQNQKFEEARKWFHFIFDPTRPPSSGSSEGFWITNPFKKEIRDGIVSIEELLLRDEYREELGIQLENWENNPFNPHAVARLRISAYMRNTVLRYIDNLVAWGDQLFRRDTIESINEATLLYILASNILGKKQEVVPARGKPVELSFAEMEESGLDQFGNVKAELESFISPSSGDDTILMPYFCLPKNDNLLKYWDTVADRLFKIRHCQNFEGIFRQLPLFEPPIDPTLLVKATAAGLDLNTILNDVNTSLPHYRFQVMLQKANEVCNDVKMLGGSLLSALEKKDAEELSLLRSGHELNMLEMIRDIKEKQKDEAEENLASLQASKVVIEERENYYDSREFINVAEALHLGSAYLSLGIQTTQAETEALAAVMHNLPDVKIGSPTTAGVTHGGTNLGNSTKAASSGLGTIAFINNAIGLIANTMGSYQRRRDDWKFQAKTAELELKQIDKQILAAEIRIAIAEKDIENHDLQMGQSREVDDYMRSKFTNAELYDYMVGKISSVYFQSYQLAYTTAQKAEKCFQYELGLENTNYIQFGYWDSLKKGLLCGEKLQYDLRRLENAYLEQNKREFEITKHISLAVTNPLAILQLKETGKCEIKLPEELFDLDFPGHYFRRIKSMSLSIPCIAGPYTSVNATLRLTKNLYRIATEGSYEKTEDEIINWGSGRFRSGSNSVSAIATSSAQNDSGVFELNFRDERYLPFEGAGVESTWSLELMGDENLRQFNYDTISDVILHLKYTATEDAALKDAAIANLKTVIAETATSGMPLSIAFDVRHEFADEWHKFVNAATGNTELNISVSKDMLPFFAASNNVEVSGLSAFAKKKDGADTEQIPFNEGQFLEFDDSVKLFKKVITGISSEITTENDFVFPLTMDKTEAVKLEEMYLLLRYKLTING